MRVPVNQLRGKARQREDTHEDRLADELSKFYTVVRQKALEYHDEQGHKQTMLMDIAIPAHKVIVEIQTKQDSKSYIAEIAREKVARNNGWTVCRLAEKDAKGEEALYRVRREIERVKR